MRRIKKPVFFIVVLCIALLGFLTFFGIHTYYGDTKTTIIKGVDEIRWGIDIQGGVNATFKPEGDYDATDVEMDAAKSVIEQRLLNLNITDSEVYVDYDHDHVIVSFPWQAGESDFDPEAAVNELGETAILTFRKGQTEDGEKVITGTDVKKAEAAQLPDDNGGYQWVVALELDGSGKKAFADATTELAGKGYISIWMDEECISAPTVSNAITDGQCHISGNFTYDSAKALADKINAGSLPFKLVASSTNTISPTLGDGAKNAMVVAGLIAFALIAVYMIAIYKLPGFVATISLAGQVIVTIAAISGFFGNAESFTLTIPGIAGIILAIGMGVDANVITAERIKEELRNGKTLNGAIELGFKRAWSSVFDGNITVVFVALILMAAFGPTDSVLATILKPLFFAFGVSTAGTIYSLGYTLLVGLILNFVFGILCSRLMIASLSKFKCFKKASLYGGYKDGQEKKEAKVLNVVKNKSKFYTVSTSLFVVFALVAVILGLNVAIEFKGGTLLAYSYDGDLDTKKIETIVEDTVDEKVTVKTVEQFSTGVKTVELSFASSEGLSSDKLAKLDAELTKQLPDNNIEGLSTTDVSPTNGKSFFLKCLVAVVFAAVVMVVYIGFRFKKIGGWSAGCMAVVALCHDMIMVFGSFVIFRFDINANFMAVLLTILGYSINATIIIYDRIRENRRLYGNKYKVEELVNMSVSQTMGRSIHTTVTTVLAMSVVCIVCAICGVTSILSFALPLIVGMVAGVYSSNCIAPTLWVMWQNRTAKKNKK